MISSNALTKLGREETAGSGSYSEHDVQILLRPLDIPTTPVAEKERLIQSGHRHDSGMISEEQAPTAAHKEMYELAFRMNKKRMASDIQSLAHGIQVIEPNKVVLVSFARTGLPVGVLLIRALRDLGVETYHYGVSIVRDRGIDMVALDAIIDAHGTRNIVFVDGWTGKGAIANEIHRTLASDPRFTAPPRLAVLTDPCGKAWIAATSEDWNIPSGILGSTVAGLISRSILPADNGLHGCVSYPHLASDDVTRNFVDVIDEERQQLVKSKNIYPALPWLKDESDQFAASSLSVIDRIAAEYSIEDKTRIKPGIAEATQAVLRRMPDYVLVQSRDDTDVLPLIHLTGALNIPVHEVGDSLSPYRAVTIIKHTPW